MKITLGSLFDGSGGFPLAGSLCDIEPIWASEIEPYPIAVTRSRFPDMIHLGDISKIDGTKIQPVDVITFGSPCQDLSIAGKRAGLKHKENGDCETTRSGLFMEAIRIIKEMRCATNGKYPRFAVWENVPGAFSSNGGEDFRIVLEEIVKINEPTATVPQALKGRWPYADTYVGDGWSLAYRTFDAQYWGVPQRRRRIYLVADFAGRSAARVLFKREGLRGYFTQGRAPWQTVATNAEAGTGTDDRARVNKETIPLSPVASTIRAGAGAPKHEQDFVGRLVLQPIVPETIDVEMEVAVRKYKVDKEKLKLLLREHKGNRTNKEIAQALEKPITLVDHWFRNDNSFAIPEPEVWFKLKKLLGITTTEFDQSITQFDFKDSNFDLRNRIYASDISPTLTCGCGNHLHLINDNKIQVKEPLAFHLLQDPTSGAVSPCMGQGNSKNGQASIGVCQATGFDGYNGALTGDQSATLGVNCGMSTGRNGVIVEKENHLFENHLQDARYNGPLKVSPTLQARLGTGGNNQPIVVEDRPVYCVQGNCIDRSDTAGCNGKGWREGASFTLNTIDRPAVVFAVDQGGGKSGANFHCNTSPTLTCTHGGEPAVSYLASGKDKFGTLQVNAGTKQWHSNQEAFSGDYHIIEENAQLYRESSYSNYIHGVGGTLRASGGANGGGSESLVVEHKPRYIVRRLTPIECARLQGFADSWGVPDYKESLTDEEYAFWLEVKNTYEAINGRTPKEYTREQILKWYNKLHTNGAEYKMWGNGVALPPTLYVMQGIYEMLSDKRE